MNQIIGNASDSSHRFSNEFSRLMDVVTTGSMAIGSSLTELLDLDEKMADITSNVAKTSTDFIKWQRQIIESSDGLLDWADKSIFTPAGDWWRDLMSTHIGVEELKAGARSFADFIIPDSQRPKSSKKAQKSVEQAPIETVEQANTVLNNRLLSTRGMRNNNPGNLRAGQGQIGRDAGGYAIFPTREAGYNAAARQLIGYNNAGLNTVNSIVTKWAPSTENNTQAYINAVVGSLNRKGFDVNAFSKLDLSNSDLLKALLDSMINHEVGSGAESFFSGSVYDVITKNQAQNDWASSVVTNSDRSKNYSISQNITIYANNPEEVRRSIDPMNTARYVTNNIS